jgi:hypothetical protein
LPVLWYLLFRLEIQPFCIEDNNIFEELDIQQIQLARLDLCLLFDLLDPFYFGMATILDNLPDAFNLFLVLIYIFLFSGLFLFLFLGHLKSTKPFELKTL